MVNTVALNEEIQRYSDSLENVPLLPIRDIVVFPYMVLPLFVGRERSIKAVDAAIAGNRIIILASQKDKNTDSPALSDLHCMGTVGAILRMLRLDDGRLKILFQGIGRAKIVNLLNEEPFCLVEISTLPDVPAQASPEIEALIGTVKVQMEKLATLGKAIYPDITSIMESMDEPGKFADLAAAGSGFKVEQAQEILEITDPALRLQMIKNALDREIEQLSA